MASVQLQGKPVALSGDFPAAGDQAVDFLLVNKKLKNVSLQNFSGKKKLIYSVPSLDTPVCAKSSRKLNELVANFSDLAVLVISADLPFAMSRFCGSQNLKNIVPLSTMRSENFASDYGLLIAEGPLTGLLARALLVLDENNKLIFARLSDDIAHEPDFDAALAVLKD